MLFVASRPYAPPTRSSSAARRWNATDRSIFPGCHLEDHLDDPVEGGPCVPFQSLLPKNGGLPTRHRSLDAAQEDLGEFKRPVKWQPLALVDESPLGVSRLRGAQATAERSRCPEPRGLRPGQTRPSAARGLARSPWRTTRPIKASAMLSDVGHLCSRSGIEAGHCLDVTNVADGHLAELQTDRQRLIDGLANSSCRRAVLASCCLGVIDSSVSCSRRLMPSRLSPRRRLWSRNPKGRPFESVTSHSESLASSTAIGLMSTP